MVYSPYITSAVTWLDHWASISAFSVVTDPALSTDVTGHSFSWQNTNIWLFLTFHHKSAVLTTIHTVIHYSFSTAKRL